MAMPSIVNASMGKNTLVLKHIVDKLRKGLSLTRRRPSTNEEWDEDEELGGAAVAVPDDVKEGHFAVFANANSECKRFVVPLSYLNHPVFTRLLKQAEEEFGFNQAGTLFIPCRPTELEKILSKRSEDERGKGDGEWDPCKSMVECF